MNAEALVTSVLDAYPGGQIIGRKRLQKLAFFATELGADAQTRFFLYDYGPFSTEVASALEMLTSVGQVDESDKQIGTGRFAKVYRLSEDSEVNERLPDPIARKIARLHRYTTIELEIASTIFFYRNRGLNWPSALEATKQLKPSKSVPGSLRERRKP